MAKYITVGRPPLHYLRVKYSKLSSKNMPQIKMLYSLLYALILHGNKYASICTWTVYMEQYYTHYTTKNSTIVSSQKYTSVDRHHGPPVQSPLLAYTNSTNQLPRDQDATGLKAKHNVIMILYMLKIILNLVVSITAILNNTIIAVF